MLTEHERQDKYLARLPKGFKFPLFNSKQAMESQRRNGYRNTAAAAREIVDNAIEAGAKKVHVVFDRGNTEKHARAESVTAIAFIDDGPGMRPQMAQYALMLGGGTHFDDPAFIGKFGFGLPNSSINQTRIVEVYTKIEDDATIRMAVLDLNTIPENGMHSIPEEVEAELPAFVRKYLKDQKWKFEHGTIVVWVGPDRLTYKSNSVLRSHLTDDFGVVYRNLLEGRELVVDGTLVQKVDPLFVDTDGLYYVKPEEGGAQLRHDRTIPVRYFKDPTTDLPRLRRIEQDEKIDMSDPSLLAVGAIQVRISRFPVGFLDFGKKVDSDARRRAEIKKTRPGMSFVRSGREIETVSMFPKTARDKGAGLGDWPLLQGYAYHMGIEVKFEPGLDDVFGITNDKQTVRPIEEFWRLMATEEVDRAVREEYRWHPKERMRLRMEEVKAERSEEPSLAEMAAASADRVTGTVPKVPEKVRPAIKANFKAEVERRARVTKRSENEVEEALIKEAKFRPYVVDFFDDPNGPFYFPEWAPSSQVVVRVNRKHQFFESLYNEAMRNGKMKHAVDVLLITLARAELQAEDETRELYKVQREEIWSPFLKKSMRALARSLAADDEEDQEDRDEAAEATA